MTIYLNMDIRKIIKEAIEQIMSEAAKGFFDIGPNIGLVVTKHTTEQIWLNLFDFKTKKSVAIITLRRVSNRAWGVTTVAADGGFGPLIFEVGMMYVSPSGICKDRIGETKDGALSIWKKFIEDRIDVKKIAIKEDEPEYSIKNAENPTKFFMENIICFKKPSIWLGKLISKGEVLIAQTGISIHEIDEIGRNYFVDRYKNG